MHIIKITTYRCPECNYAQDHAPSEYHTNRNFNQDRFFQLHIDGVNHQRKQLALQTNTAFVPIEKKLEVGKCPNCHLQGVSTDMVKETRPEHKSTITIYEDHEIDDLVKTEDGMVLPKTTLLSDMAKVGKVIKHSDIPAMDKIRLKQRAMKALQDARKLEDVE